MSEPFNFTKRLEAARKRVQERREAGLKFFGDPKPQPKYIAETVIEGKTVAEWAKEVDVVIEQADDLRRIDLTRIVVIDMTEAFPGAVTDAVRRWRAAGSPTEYTETATKVQAANGEWEKHIALANLERDKASAARETGNEKKAEQHERYAQRELVAAEKALAVADKLRKEWKKEHP